MHYYKKPNQITGSNDFTCCSSTHCITDWLVGGGGNDIINCNADETRSKINTRKQLKQTRLYNGKRLLELKFKLSPQWRITVTINK